MNTFLKYDLPRAGETGRCSNDYLKTFSIADFDTWKYSWEMQETPSGETDFLAVGLWLAAQVTQTALPGFGFWCFFA